MAITNKTQKTFKPGRGYSREDWDAVSDNPHITKERMKQGKPLKEVLPDVYESIQRSRGRPRLDKAKEAVTLRVDPDVVKDLKAEVDNWRNVAAEHLLGTVFIHPMYLDLETGKLVDKDVIRIPDSTLDDAIRQHFGENVAFDTGNLANLLGSAAFVKPGHKVEKKMVYKAA